MSHPGMLQALPRLPWGPDGTPTFPDVWPHFCLRHRLFILVTSFPPPLPCLVLSDTLCLWLTGLWLPLGPGHQATSGALSAVPPDTQFLYWNTRYHTILSVFQALCLEPEDSK